ncbi:MAG: hypothetical protein C5B43_03670 [Verrucomicrobia bacterium]|nr:MAG: hypothetical protein C5B43_03670 [Verrucomicrobiota bacterium]
MKKSIKKISLILLALIPCCSSLFGKVTFELKFTDYESVGFKAPRNAWMKEVAQEAMDIIGEIIDQDAHVNIEIKSNFKIPCAVSYPRFWHIESEESNQKAILEAHHRILTGNIQDDGKIHGQIEFNTFCFLEKYRHFLRRTIIHELTHLLGFIPWKIDNKKEYNDYDKLLHDGDGNYFLIGKNPLRINPKFNCKTGLYACGLHIKALNEGESITIYCPKKYEGGSSYAHLDFKAHPLSIMNPSGSLDDYPIWNKCELGLMQDLGYKINWDHYNQLVDKLTSERTSS